MNFEFTEIFERIFFFVVFFPNCHFRYDAYVPFSVHPLKLIQIDTF